MITSTQNKRVASAVKLKKRGLREPQRRFLVEGAQATAEALDAEVVETVFHVTGATGRVPEVVAKAGESGVETLEVSEAVMAHLTSAVTPQGLVAIARYVDVGLSKMPVGGTIAVLCAVRDPGNAGTILRSADAAGASGVVFSGESVDVYNAKTVRASAGSLFHLPVVRGEEPPAVVAALRERGTRVLAADAHGGTTIHETDLSGSTAVLFGNEAWGLPPEVRGLADGLVRVPIHGRAESLNLAAAATVVLFEAARQRRRSHGEIGPLLAAASHDLRLPLTALKAVTSTVVERWADLTDEARRELVAAMLLDLDRVSAMTSMLVDAARLEQGRGPRPAEPQPVADVMAVIARVFAASSDYPDVATSGDAVTTLEADRLEAMLLAMCEGAMWWGQEGPIEMVASRDGERAVVEVRRHGPSPDPEELEATFAGADQGKLVLHLARRVAEGLGGSITADANDGVRFRLTI